MKHSLQWVSLPGVNPTPVPTIARCFNSSNKKHSWSAAMSLSTCSTAEAEPADNGNLTPRKQAAHRCPVMLSDTETTRAEWCDPRVGGLSFRSLYNDIKLKDLLMNAS